MRRILVTGDQGFIGSYLAEKVGDYTGFDLKSGHNILTDELPDADVIIHLAAQTSVIDSLSDPACDAETNILGTIRLLERYKDALFIFASSGGAIQEKIESPYGLSKFCAEEYIKLLHSNYVILRFPNIYGTGSKSVVDKFINGPVNIYGDGTSTRDYIHVNDLVRAIISSMDWEPGMYSLGSGVNTSVLDIARATGKEVRFTDAVKGELQDSFVKNTAPNWHPDINVINYVKSKSKAR